MFQQSTSQPAFAHYRSISAENLPPARPFSASDHVLKSVHQSVKSSSRVVISGSCNFTPDRCQPFIGCRCSAGQYYTPATSDSVCKDCGHTLIQHQIMERQGFDPYGDIQPLLGKNVYF